MVFWIGVPVKSNRFLELKLSKDYLRLFYLPSLGLNILYCLSLVQNHVLPFQSVKSLIVRHYQLIAGNYNVERGVSKPHLLLLEEFPQSFPLLNIAPVRQDIHHGRELFQLTLPVVKSRARGDD